MTPGEGADRSNAGLEYANPGSPKRERIKLHVIRHLLKQDSYYLAVSDPRDYHKDLQKQRPFHNLLSWVCAQT